jgi:TPP-dependent pyruvate/acetoin dehydrogenase alpha subunit
MPQAAGAAYAIKIDSERQGDCVICYFGDGPLYDSHEDNPADEVRCGE